MTFPLLQDKVATITGAAMGMGPATAQLLAEAGAKASYVTGTVIHVDAGYTSR